jgi:hypothetical protein
VLNDWTEVRREEEYWMSVLDVEGLIQIGMRYAQAALLYNGSGEKALK